MTSFETISELYTNYIRRCEDLEAVRKPWDGIFGLGNDPSKDPCHDAFAADLKAAMAEAAASAPADELRQIAELAYTAPRGHKNERMAYWMLLAVHGMTLDLIPRLEPGDAAALLELYQNEYPKMSRLPVQRKVVEALKARK